MSKQSVKRTKTAIVSTTQEPPATLSAKSHQQLEDMHIRFGNEEVATQMWNDVFSQADRGRLGNDFDRARVEHRGTIGMAMAVWSCSRAEAVLRLCEAFQSYDPVTRKRLWRESGLQNPREGQIPFDKPIWDGHTDLRFREEVIRKTRGRKIAKNITAILDAFQANGWPDRIEDPLPGAPDGQRLREAIADLNHKLPDIRFSAADGGVSWKIV